MVCGVYNIKFENLFPNSAFCGTDFKLPNGIIIKRGKKAGESVVFKCKKGYELEGSSVRVCLSSGSWSGIMPKCKSKLFRV